MSYIIQASTPADVHGSNRGTRIRTKYKIKSGRQVRITEEWEEVESFKEVKTKNAEAKTPSGQEKLTASALLPRVRRS